MSDKILHLPPDHQLSPAHRADLRRRFHDEIRRERRTRSRWSTPALVAGTAVAAVAGVVTVGAVVHDSRSVPAAAGPTDPSLDRCWSAVNKAGKANLYPAGEKWTVALRSNVTVASGSTMLGVRAGNTVFFCDVAPTTVQVSAPVADPPQQLRPLLAISDGPVGGLSDGRKSLKLTFASKTEPQWSQAESKMDSSKDLFVAGTMPGNTYLADSDPFKGGDPTKNGKPSRKKALPDAPPPAVTVVDRPHAAR